LEPYSCRFGGNNSRATFAPSRRTPSASLPATAVNGSSPTSDNPLAAVLKHHWAAISAFLPIHTPRLVHNTQCSVVHYAPPPGLYSFASFNNDAVLASPAPPRFRPRPSFMRFSSRCSFTCANLFRFQSFVHNARPPAAYQAYPF